MLWHRQPLRSVQKKHTRKRTECIQHMQKPNKTDNADITCYWADISYRSTRRCKLLQSWCGTLHREFPEVNSLELTVSFIIALKQAGIITSHHCSRLLITITISDMFTFQQEVIHWNKPGKDAPYFYTLTALMLTSLYFTLLTCWIPSLYKG